MTQLLSLPPELLNYISELCEMREIKSLRLVCKQLDEQLAPEVLDTLTFHMHKDRYQRTMDMIRTLYCEPHGAAPRVTKHLVLKSLSPQYDENPSTVYHYIGGELVEQPEPQVPQEILDAEAELENILFDALHSLKSVESVRWEPGESDRKWAHTSVLDALLSYKNLTKLEVYLPYALIPVPFHLLTTLREIDFDEHVSKDKTIGRRSFNNLAQLLAQSPPGKITRLAVHREWHKTRTSQAHSLHDLFRFVDQNGPSWTLEHLELFHSFVRLDPVIASHLRHLKSLRLEHALEPVRQPIVLGVRGSFERCGVVPDDVFERQQAVGTSLNQFWMDLARERIFLEEIWITNIVPGFLQYLTMYSGLRKLSLWNGLWDNTAASETVAENFFGEPFKLATHINTLEHLSIHITYEGSWCLGRHNLNQLCRLKSLKTLEMTVIRADVEIVEREPNAENAQEDVFKLLIDTIALQLPNLQKLNLGSAVLERLRGQKLGTLAHMHRRWVLQKIISQIERYRAPPSYFRLPVLRTWMRDFYPEPFMLADGMRVLGYREEHRDQ